MLIPTAEIMRSKEAIHAFLQGFFKQFTNHRATVETLRRKKRRSEYVHVDLEIGKATVSMQCRQLSDLYKVRDGAVLRQSLIAAEVAGQKPILVVLSGNGKELGIVVGRGGPKPQALDGASLKALREMPAPAEKVEVDPASSKELIILLSKRVGALEELAMKHNLHVPEGYNELRNKCAELAARFLA